MPLLDTPFITISGLPSFEEQQIDFPSGIFGITIRAHLSALNATFGFNQQPHKFELEYIPEKFSDESLPSIGSGIQFFIGDEFLIQGRITHTDFQKSSKGNIVSVSIDDIRKDLNNFVVDTYGIFGSEDTPTKDIIDVRYWYIKNFAETRTFGRSVIIRDLDLLDKSGASYRQIYEAVKYFEEQVGTINDVISKLPRPEVIESQLPYDPDSYRWQFKAQPLLEVLARILGDVSFDFYWNMESKHIDVINRKFAINIDRTKIPVANDTAKILSLKYGFDEAERATSVRLYGAPMEGLIGIGHLKAESGAYEISASGTGHDLYDMGITITGLGKIRPTFVPGWRDARIKFFAEDGSIQIDNPTDRELKAAMKGIEYWAMEKGLENRIDKSTVHQLEGNTNSQVSRASASGLGYIPNRGQLDREWVMEWYNRVRSFAQNHFARTYVLSPNSILYDQLDEFDVVSAAWCNIENLTDDGSFEDNYKIKSKYRWLAPFWDQDNNKMRGWASIPVLATTSRGVYSPKWGADGKATPAQFTSWNEEETMQYVPIEIRKWERAEDKFQEEFLSPLFRYEKGLMIILPNTCWKRYDLVDPTLSNKPILKFYRGSFGSETQADIVTDPTALGEVYEEITEVAIPIKTKRRYGYKWPSPWASGTGTDFEVQVLDDLAPWEFEPRGTKKSWELMDNEARSVITSRVVNRNRVTFAEVQKLGLPIISFDNFANQEITPDGYGIVSHGVTSLNITKNTGWWQTKYNIKSHFPQLIRIKPIKDKTEEDFEFIIRRLQAKIVPPAIAPFISHGFFNDETKDGRAIFSRDLKNTIVVAVTITNVFDEDTSNPYYVGIDDKGITWPAAFRNITSLNTNSQLFQERKAFAIDGFLQVGMSAIYHYEDREDGSFTHYFTGGIQLSASRIVQMTETPRLVQAIWRANVTTISETVYNKAGQPVIVQPFTIKNVPFLNQQAVDTSLKNGDKVFMGSNGNENRTIKPNFDVAKGDSNGAGKDSVRLINTGVPSAVGFALVTTRPDNITGLGGQVQTISTAGGSKISDGQTIGGTKYNVRFVGVEYDQVAIGDPCITIQEKETTQSGQIRLFCFIVKPTMAPYTAGGPGPFLT